MLKTITGSVNESLEILRDIVSCSSCRHFIPVSLFTVDGLSLVLLIDSPSRVLLDWTLILDEKEKFDLLESVSAFLDSTISVCWRLDIGSLSLFRDCVGETRIIFMNICDEIPSQSCRLGFFSEIVRHVFKNSLPSYVEALLPFINTGHTSNRPAFNKIAEIIDRRNESHCVKHEGKPSLRYESLAVTLLSVVFGSRSS